jgi:predicted esterase
MSPRFPFLLLVLVLAFQAQPTPAPGKDLRLTYRSAADSTEQPYRLYVPSTYDGSRAMPLVVALHGTTGDQNTFFDNPRYLGRPIVRAAEKYGMLVVCPWAREPREYRGTAEYEVFQTIAEVRQSYRVDPDRIYLTGHSMGGTGTGYLALHYPDVFAAAAPLSAHLAMTWLMPNNRHVPFWWIAGADESPQYLLALATFGEGMRKLGNPVRTTLLEKQTHYGSVQDMDMVLEWLGQHRRVRAPREYAFVVDTPFHGQAYWTRVDALANPTRIASLAVRLEEARIQVQPENVKCFVVFAEPAIMPLDREVSVSVGGKRVWAGRLRADQEIRLDNADGRWTASLSAQKRRELTDLGRTRVGTAPRRLSMAGVEAPLANWMTDAMRFASGAEIAMVNRQFYRGKEIESGAVGMRDLLDALCVSDMELVTATLTGRDLVEILDDNVPDAKKDVHYVKDGPHASRLVQLSGARYTFDPGQPEGKRIVASDLVADRTYTVAFEKGSVTTPGLILLAGRFGRISLRSTGIPIHTALYGYALHQGTLVADPEGRVREVSGSDRSR